MNKEKLFKDQDHWKREVICKHELVIFRAITDKYNHLLGWKALTPDRHKELGRYSTATRLGNIHD
jgi:hypothetical protein